MKQVKKIFPYLAILLVLIQFIRPEKNIEISPSNDRISNNIEIPVNVIKILKTSCYDCHSNNTRYPWYNTIAPVSWILKNHIDEAKDELNFSEWNTYSVKKKKHKIHEMEEEIEAGEMPLKSYTFIHRNAILSKSDKKIFLKWLKTIPLE